MPRCVHLHSKKDLAFGFPKAFLILGLEFGKLGRFLLYNTWIGYYGRLQLFVSGNAKVQSANYSYFVQRITKRCIYYSKLSNYLIIKLCVFLLYLLFSSAECLTHSFFWKESTLRNPSQILLNLFLYAYWIIEFDAIIICGGLCRLFCAKLVCADEKVYSLRTSNIPSTFNETLS